jgi:ketosteroid isomerase-like protein
MNNPNPIHELTLSVFNAMNTRDFSELEKNITDDVAFDFPGVGRVEGSKRVLIFLKALLRKYKHLAFTITEVIEGSQRACAIWTNRGEHINGNAYANSGVTLLHFSDNKISFISDYFKDTSFVESS